MPQSSLFNLHIDVHYVNIKMTEHLHQYSTSSQFTPTVNVPRTPNPSQVSHKKIKQFRAIQYHQVTQRNEPSVISPTVPKNQSSVQEYHSRLPQTSRNKAVQLVLPRSRVPPHLHPPDHRGTSARRERAPRARHYIVLIRKSGTKRDEALSAEAVKLGRTRYVYMCVCIYPRGSWGSWNERDFVIAA